MSTRFSTKQAFLFTVINYLGVLIGIVSTLFIYPQDKDLLGIIRFIDGFAQILYPIMVLGASTALLNFQPQLNDFFQRKLFSFSMISIVGMIVLCAFGVTALYYSGSIKNTQYFIYAFCIAICLAYVDLFKRQATNLQRLAFPTFFEKILPKIALPAVFIMVLYFAKTEVQGLQFYTLSFVLILAAVATYLFRHFKPVYTLKFDDLFQQIPKKQYYQYSLYAFCASLGSFLAFRIDSIMIPEFISNEANGDYNIGVNLANALMIPATGVFALYSPMISQALKTHKLNELKVKYAEVAKNLFFIGILMYGCVLLGMKDLFDLLSTKDKLAPTLPIIYLLGANVLFNIATGFNTEIIAYSKYYRFNLIAILLLAVSNIGLNYFVLTQTSLGIMGVAYTSLFSMVVFNCVKLWFIYRKLHMLPFNTNYLKTFGSSMVLLGISFLLPLDVFNRFGFVVRCAFFVVLLTLLIYKKGWVPELNNSVKKLNNFRKS